MGYVDIFRKLWGWLSGETGVVETGSSSVDKVNFLSTTDSVKMKHTITDRIDF